ncbi:TonB-dependent receptor [Microbulbifer marinus]|uniref:Outer membrane receptor proteins, mostly Fe transport n=1 Tax=Microbulbifer marinus TaxID=658218 RepID=A0A1H3W158_9GAMM|nr:TonB-dependent receptor [Microbulbifer marinus]SDZ80793.1 Outer membrane receptor proteins, mostly Fe transport [Microbulbifer marinus]
MRFALIPLFVICGSASAEQTRLETLVVTASRLEQPLADHAGSLSSLDGESLQMVGHNHIQQSLVRIPGANFARGEGQEYLPSLRSPVLTGAGACGSLLVMEDGIPLRAAGFCNVNELFESHSEQARRIEVVRGPAGSLYGSNAMHGVVNIIGASVAEESGGSIGVEAGPNQFVRTTVSVDSGKRADSGVRADLSLSHDGGYRADSGYAQQKLSLVHEAAVGAVAVRTRLAATNLNQETAGYIEGESAYKDRQLSRSNPNPEAFRDARALRLSSELDFGAVGGGQLRVTPYLRTTDMVFRQHYLPGQALEENGQRGVGLRTIYHAELARAARFSAGVDAEYSRGYLREFQDAATSGSEFLRETIPVGSHYDYRVDATMLAPFVHASWQAADRLTLQAGLRYEYMGYDYDNQMLAGRTRADGTACGFGGCRFNRPADQSDDFRSLSPSFGAVYRLNPGLQLFANLAQGFRVPQATELYRLQREQTVAELDAEEIRSLELGVRGEEDHISYELVAYAMGKDNVIFRDADYFNQSNGETAHSGLELELDYTLASDWRVQISASYAEHRYRDERLLGGDSIQNNLVDSAPRHFGSSRLLWQPEAALSWELEWVHQGRYYTDPENRHSYPGHELLNLRARWEWQEGWELAVRALNLTDEAYAERADFSNFSGDRYFPGGRRSLYLAVSTGW